MVSEYEGQLFLNLFSKISVRHPTFRKYRALNYFLANICLRKTENMLQADNKFSNALVEKNFRHAADVENDVQSQFREVTDY